MRKRKPQQKKLLKSLALLSQDQSTPILEVASTLQELLLETFQVLPLEWPMWLFLMKEKSLVLLPT